MANTQLLIRLRELHEELSVINDDLRIPDQVEETTINELGQLITDVSDLIDHTADSIEQHSDCEELDALLARIAQFHVEHPRVKSFLEQVKNMLTMI